MNKVELNKITLVGIALKSKTSNLNGQSGIDCGALWQEFEKGNYIDKIPEKLSDEIFSVYHSYEGDHTKPYSYFIGCKVKNGTLAPNGMETLTINGGAFQKIIAKGVMPDCVINTWKEIWNSEIPRKYDMDFEVYDERSKDWNNVEVEIYLSIKLNIQE